MTQPQHSTVKPSLTQALKHNSSRPQAQPARSLSSSSMQAASEPCSADATSALSFSPPILTAIGSSTPGPFTSTVTTPPPQLSQPHGPAPPASQSSPISMSSIQASKNSSKTSTTSSLAETSHAVS